MLGQDSKTIEKWFKENIQDRVTITGYRRLGYHNHRVSGDREAFNLTTAYGQGDQQFTDIGSVYVSGRNVLGLLNFDFNIQDDRFQDPQGQKFSVDARRGPWSVKWGDIQGSLLNTNQFAQYRKTVRGTSLGYKAGGFEARVLHTEVRGEPRTVSIQGNNSSGPYFLQSSQIVRGSESIQVDGEDQSFGTDYTIDYDLGSINFLNRQTLEGRIIPPTSTIVATYETFGFTGSRGTLMGGGVSYDMGSAGKVGVTMLSQRQGGDGRLSTRLEKFQGFGPAGTPYTLQFEPLTTSPIVIRLDGVLQTEFVDYTIDPDNAAIFYFTRFVPSTSTIDVLYTPKPTNTVNGDRETVGIDYQLPIRMKDGGGSLQISSATGSLKNTPTPQSGTANAASLRMKQGKAEVNASFRDIPQGYTSVETVGFNRNERASNLRMSYKLSSSDTLSSTYRNSRIAARSVDASGTATTIPSRFTSASLSWSRLPLGGGLPFNLSHTRTMSSRLGDETQIDTTTLGSSWQKGRLTARANLSHQDARGDFRLADGTQAGSLSLDGLELQTTYRASNAWQLSASTSLNQVRAAGETGSGRDLQLGVTHRGGDKFDANLVFTDSDAGSVSTISGLNSGYGFGYDGNGFSGGALGDPLRGVSSFRRLSLNSNYRPTDRLSFGAGFTYYRTEGSVSSNSETRSFLIGADYTAGRDLRVSGTLSLDNTDYIQSGFRSEATSFSLAFDGDPAGRLRYSGVFSGLLTGGSQFAQDAYNADLSMGYFLADRQNLSLIFRTGQTRGFRPQDEQELSLIYQYQIWRSLAINVGYKWRDISSLDPAITSGAFTSSGFDIELAFNFGRN